MRAAGQCGEKPSILEKRFPQLRETKNLRRGYVITRDMSDFDVLPLEGMPAATRLLKIPAPLACYWLGQSELRGRRPAPVE
jgi:hypothetical protein